MKRIRYSVNVGSSSIDQDAVGEPASQQPAGLLVAVGAAPGHVDVDDVVRVASGQGVSTSASDSTSYGGAITASRSTSGA